jgi:hypothetical protein
MLPGDVVFTNSETRPMLSAVDSQERTVGHGPINGETCSDARDSVSSRRKGFGRPTSGFALCDFAYLFECRQADDHTHSGRPDTVRRTVHANLMVSNSG